MVFICALRPHLLAFADPIDPAQLVRALGFRPREILSSMRFLQLCVFAGQVSSAVLPRGGSDIVAVIPQAQAPLPTPLVNFQVAVPVLTPGGSSDQYGCVYTKVLMEYDFAASYGHPFVGPNSRACFDFNF